MITQVHRRLLQIDIASEFDPADSTGGGRGIFHRCVIAMPDVAENMVNKQRFSNSQGDVPVARSGVSEQYACVGTHSSLRTT
jgi:hypothetical protein